MKKGQFGARKNKFDVEKFDGNMINFYSFMNVDNQIVRKTNTDFQSLLREFNTYKNKAILEYLTEIGLVKFDDINLNDIDFMKKLTISYLNHLRNTYLSKEGAIQINGSGYILNFDDEFNKISMTEQHKNDFFRLFKNVNYRDFIDEVNDAFIDLIYLMTFLYNASLFNKEDDFSDVLKAFNDTMKEYVSHLDFHDAKDEETFEAVFYNYSSIYKYYIDDFQTYIIKSKRTITESNYQQVFKDFKNIATKSKKINSRREIQKKLNLNLSDYFRAAAFQVLNIEPKN